MNGHEYHTGELLNFSEREKLFSEKCAGKGNDRLNISTVHIK